uniref:Uncharacterized protein n=1 Tax=Lepeophtheirus salmonis TaxID=72036 RepID=A0A0K2T4S6_LEPSM
MKLPILLLFLLSSETLGKPYGDDNNDFYSNDDYGNPDSAESVKQETEQVITLTPNFVTEPVNKMVNQGGTIELPCIVDRLEGFVLLWKKGEQILAVSKQIIDNQSDRIKLVQDENDNGNTLVISDAQPEDVGDYSCQVSAYNPKELKHSIRIRVKPEIVAVPSSGIIVAKTGESVTLACEILKGDPTPEVKWRRHERKMPSGEEWIRGLSITYTSVSRHHSGHYICDADNGFGEESLANIKLDVQHAPEIEQEETFIHTGAGDETEVICIVHSSPKASLTWFKDEVPLGTESEFEMNQRGNRHTLLISNIDENKFGKYRCEASNEFGIDSKTTEVSGRAGIAVIKSDPKGMAYEQFSLNWISESFTPITKFKLQYKLRESLEDWKEIEIPASHLDRELYEGSYTLSDLIPASVYLARIASMNDYGYNDYGEAFKFATRGADPIQKPITGTGSASLHQGSLSFLLSVFLLHYVNYL